MLLRTLSLFLFITIPFYISAQENEAQVKTSYVQGGLNFLSNAIYQGRKDSARAPYLSLGMAWHHKSGFYAGSDLSILTTAKGGFDLLTLTMGYEFEARKKWDGGAYLTRNFYNQSSYAVKSELKWETGAYLGYDFGPLALQTNAGLNFGTNSDIALGLSLYRSFYLAGEKLEITPTATGNAGTLNYYKSYFENRKFSRTRRNGTVVTLPTQPIITDAGDFKLLDYEFSLPLKYSLQSFEFYITPTYAIPLNPVTIKRGLFTRTEELSNSFFGEVGINYSF